MSNITPESVNARVDKMLEWSTGVAKQIKALQDKLAPDVEQARAIEESIIEAQAIQVSRSGEMATLELEMADLRADIAEQKEQVKELEAVAMLSAEGSNQPKRQAAMRKVLKDNTEYQAIKAALQINERGKLVKQAHYDNAEREYKRIGSQLRNLRARLEHWTARAKLSIGE
jgi:hypothetical protein